MSVGEIGTGPETKTLRELRECAHKASAALQEAYRNLAAEYLRQSRDVLAVRYINKTEAVAKIHRENV